VALSSDGSTVVVGGPADASNAGAAWVFWTCPWAAVPVANFTYLPGAPLPGQVVTFTDQSSNAPTAWLWDFGDGANSGAQPLTTPSVTHTYNAAGTYTVSLIAANCKGSNADLGLGGLGIFQRQITVSAPCTGASITVPPQSQSISSGQTASLSVTATGTAPLSYQWYLGVSGDTSTPVGTNVSNLTTPPLTSTTSFWVSVSNACGHADSATATVTVAAPTTYTVWVPVASHNPGKLGSQWRSDLGLLDAGSVTANVQINFFGGTGVVSSTTYVPPKTQSILTDVVGQIGGSNSGALQIISDQPLKVTARSYNQVAADAACYPFGTQGQDYPAVVSSDGLAAQQSAYLAGLTENATYRCNIGVVNTGTGSASVLVELFDGAGTKLGEYPVTLAPGEWSQATQPFLSVAGQTAMDRGYAKITVQSGSGVFGFASVISNITTDPTTVAMQR
jgi:hypothetical protein